MLGRTEQKLDVRKCTWEAGSFFNLNRALVEFRTLSWLFLGPGCQFP